MTLDEMGAARTDTALDLVLGPFPAPPHEETPWAPRSSSPAPTSPSPPRAARRLTVAHARRRPCGAEPDAAPMPRWIFLRHGLSRANIAHLVSDDPEVPLTPAGQTQAAAAGAALAQTAISAVLSSDLTRARETAAMAITAWAARSGHPAPPVQPVSWLRERRFGAWSGLTRTQMDQRGHRAALRRWETRPPGGESYADVAARVLGGIRSLAPLGPTLVVAHTAVIQVLLGASDGVAPADIGRIAVPNAQPFIREVPTGAWADLPQPVRD